MAASDLSDLPRAIQIGGANYTHWFEGTLSQIYIDKRALSEEQLKNTYHDSGY